MRIVLISDTHGCTRNLLCPLRPADAHRRLHTPFTAASIVAVNAWLGTLPVNMIFQYDCASSRRMGAAGRSSTYIRRKLRQSPGFLRQHSWYLPKFLESDTSGGLRTGCLRNQSSLVGLFGPSSWIISSDDENRHDQPIRQSARARAPRGPLRKGLQGGT